jgi:hypothetical protein
MSLGGDIERVMSMLHRANIPYVVAKDYSWLETSDVRFCFRNVGRWLYAVIPSDPTAGDDATATTETRSDSE